MIFFCKNNGGTHLLGQYFLIPKKINESFKWILFENSRKWTRLNKGDARYFKFLFKKKRNQKLKKNRSDGSEKRYFQ